MIFYFTGTGNSLYAAKKIASEGEKLINIAEAVRNRKFSYTIPDNENTGFVFPVYFYSLPDIVADFCKKLRLKNTDYVYAVITCGAGIGGSGGLLREILAKHDITLDRVFDVVMPDNAIFFYNIPDEKTNLKKLDSSDKPLSEIKKKISEKETGKIAGALTAKLGRTMYSVFRKTKKFYADNSCVGCGLCARSCPVGAIKMTEGKPKWIKEVCTKCTACINCCPSKAIQYGKATIKRNRYVNPVFKEK